MSYALESKEESQRLTKQNSTDAYDFKKESEFFSIRPYSRVLDVGCGNGEVTQYLADKNQTCKFIGVDASSERIKEAHKNPSVYDFINCNIDKLDSVFGNRAFDCVFTRFCLQHLPDPKLALQKYWCLLVDDGRLIVVETDRLMVGLIHSNSELAEMLEVFQEKIECNLNMGSQLPTIVKEAGFEVISERREIFKFETAEELTKEYENNASRLGQCFESLVRIFGDNEKAKRFKELYLMEMVNPANSYSIAKHIFELRKIPRGTKES